MAQPDVAGFTRVSADCDRCGSAGSVEFGMCQVCLSELGPDAETIPLAPMRVPAASEDDLTLVLPA